MPQVKTEDDLRVFIEFGVPKSGERVFTKELGEFLNIAEREIKKFCRRRGVLQRVRTAWPPRIIYWVTPHTAANVILFIRALQEDKSKGGCWHKKAAVSRAQCKKYYPKRAAHT